MTNARHLRASIVSLSLGLTLLGLARTTGAQPAPPGAQGKGPASSPSSTTSRYATVVDPRVDMMFELRAKTGRSGPFYARSVEFEQTGELPTLVRFNRKIDEATWARYAKKGARSEAPLWSGAVPVSMTESALAAMRADGVLEHVSVNLAPPRLVRPLDHARRELSVYGGAETFRKNTGNLLTGKGVRVGDIDSTADVFHPAFFRPLKSLAWVDVNQDGKLTPGTDGIDLDGDGTIAPTEVLKQLNGVASSLYGSPSPLEGTEDTQFNPAWDYLYIDLDGDGRRTYGGADATNLPGMGEPIFAADDANGDGKLLAPERVVQLGEPKFKAIRHVKGAATKEYFRRGENLGAFQPFGNGDDAEHGTGVLGTVAGGQLNISRYLGLAPDVDLNLASYGTESEAITPKLQWLLNEGVDVVLTELGSWAAEPSDGSTELEKLMDTAVDNGVVLVSPAGNLGWSTKHAFATLPATGSALYENSLNTQDGQPGYIFASLTWREGANEATGSVSTSDGDSFSLDNSNNGQALPSGRVAYVTKMTTSKGAGFLGVIIDMKNTSIPAGGIKFQVGSKTDTPLTASLYVIDDISGWSGGTNWDAGDVDGCMNSPSFASKTLAVSAYALNVGNGFSNFGESEGQLRGYSGRGPDLWGAQGIAISAPDNAIAAAPDSYNGNTSQGSGVGVAWREFGGTSGAGPEVAGIVALLKQANPTKSGAELRQLVIDNARTDAIVQAGTPEQFGAGKLGLGITPAAGTPPTVTLTAQAEAAPGDSVVFTAQVTDTGATGTPKARWDNDYDGTFDTDLADALTSTLTMPASGPLDVKVEIVDADGWSGFAVARVNQIGQGPGGAAGSGGTAGSSGASGSAGSSGDAGSSGSSGSAGSAAPPNPPHQSDDGCGCQVPGATRASTGSFGLIAALGLLLSRRRKAITHKTL